MREAVRVLYVYDGSVPAQPDSDRLAGASERVEINAVRTVDQAINCLESGSFDCILSTRELSDGDGIALLRRLRTRSITLPFVLYVSDGSERIASEALSAGVTEYVRATPEADRIATVVDRIERAVREHPNHSEYRINEVTDLSGTCQ